MSSVCTFRTPRLMLVDTLQTTSKHAKNDNSYFESSAVLNRYAYTTQTLFPPLVYINTLFPTSLLASLSCFCGGTMPFCPGRTLADLSGAFWTESLFSEALNCPPLLQSDILLTTSKLSSDQSSVSLGLQLIL